MIVFPSLGNLPQAGAKVKFTMYGPTNLSQVHSRPGLCLLPSKEQ